MGAFAWVTLATNDSYSLGALVLAHSLKQAGTAHQLTVLVTPGVTSAMREKLASVFNIVQEVNILDSKDEANLKLLKRPELGITFTKLHCWRLTQFEKCVFLDADTLVLHNSDELFEREELSAAPDVGWPDCFNSGVFVYRPSLDTYDKLIQFAIEKGSFDGGDQGLLNLYFSDWAHKDISRHLPFIYNMCSTACYSYLPAFKQFGANAKIIHFIGSQKPWLQYFNTETRKVQPSGDSAHLQEILQRWWDLFCSLIHPHLSPAMAGLAGAFSKLTLGVARTPEQDAIENVLRKQAWELGNIDYLGKDSFDNIWSKITETLSFAPAPEAPAPEAPAPEAPASEAPAETLSQTALQEEATSEQCLVEPPSDNKISDISKIDSPETSSIVDAQKDFELAPQENIIPANKKSIAEITQSTEATKSVAVRGSGEVSKLVATPQKVADIITKSEVPAPVVEPIVEPSVCPIPPKKEVGDTPVAAVAPSPTLKLESSPTQEIPPLSESPVVFKGTDVLSPVNAPPENATTTVVTFASVSSPALPIVGPADTAELPSWNFPGTPKVIESSVTPSTITETKAPFTEEEAELPRISTAPSMVKGSESPADPSGAVESHKTKITEATPPVSPGTPPVERAKPALAAEAGLPDTPPPTEGSSTPTPPPRKTDKPKKTAAKPKK